MRSIIILVICLLFRNINAQVPIPLPLPKNVSDMAIIDSGNIKVWYALNAIDYNNIETYDDLQCLEIGSYISKYFSFFVFNSDSLCTDWGKKHPYAQSAPIRLGVCGKKNRWSEYYYSEYIKNFHENILTEYARMPMWIDNYQYSENIPVIDWTLFDDTLSINGYLCQKATCRFRNRHYTAWFTTDIPVSNGPWKFGRLPGLIIEISDNDQLYIFKCVKFESFKNKYPIKIYDYKNYKEIDRKKLLQLQKNINENFFKVIGSIPRNKYTEIPYQPLELE